MPRLERITAALIKELALETGFDQVGIVRFEKIRSEPRELPKWIEEGRHGTMKYLEEYSRRREDFFRSFPEAQSVIVLAANYFSPEPEDAAAPAWGNSGNLKGLVSRYARGRDYHEVLGKRLDALVGRILQAAGRNFKWRLGVDSQPVPEKIAAKEAGLGLIGKHTVLLNAAYGPWLFLAEIVTDLDLEEDAVTPGNCGPCARCRKVCPTGALDQDYRLDARLCVAYLTIEHKGVIPRQLRALVGNRVFGCDECFAICPWTARQKETYWKEFQPSSGVGKWLDFKELFSVTSNRGYEDKFRGTALFRTGRIRMLRNACVVLGNSGLEEAVDLLEKGLDDTSPLVRLHAAWGLGRFAALKARKILHRKLFEEKDPEVRKEIAFALGRM